MIRRFAVLAPGLVVSALSCLLASAAFAADDAAPAAAAPTTAPALEVVRLRPVDDEAKAVSPIDQMVDSLLAKVTNKETGEPSHQEAFDEIVGLEQPAVSRLATVLHDQNAAFDARWVAARALGKIGGTRATKELREALAKDHFSMVRVAAIRGLKDLHDEGSFDAYVKALGDDAVVVRSAAADALGALGDPRAVPPLVKALDRDDNFYRGRSLWVRRHIIAALGATESKSTVPVLMKALDDSDPTVHREAISQLERVTRVSFRIPAANEMEWMNKATPKWKAWWEQNKKDYL